MITKKEILLFSISCIAIVFYAFSGDNTQPKHSLNFDTKEDKLLVGKIRYKNAELATVQKNRLLKQKRDVRVFKTRLSKNNLTQTLEHARASVPPQSQKKVAVPTATKVAKKKKEEKKDDKEKKVAKKESNLKPIQPLSPDADTKAASNKPVLETKDLSSISYTTNIPAPSATAAQNLQQEEEKDGAVANVANHDSQAVDSLASISPKATSKKSIKKSIFTSLLEAERFTDFEQLMLSDLSEEKRIQAYQDALNVLFASSDEKAQEYDAFIYNHFFNDKYAVVISKSLNDPKMSYDKVRYSVSYLNQVVIEWRSESGNAIFKQIYQDNVANILSFNEDRKDMFTGLQSSIKAKSILLNENAIEVSAN